MAFTAKDVAELRKQTGCGMMDCKKALTETNGDFEAAVKYLREKGMGAVAKKIKEMEDLEKSYGGIKEMETLPSAVFIVDTRKERNAVLEAKKLGIPVVAIVDTNCDPDDADCIIPGNDDAIRAIKLIAGALANAVIEARGGVQEEATEAAEEVVAEEAAAEEAAE